MSSIVFTVGHSTHTLDALIEILRRHRVATVIDVRSTPYSRHIPHFNRENLDRALDAHGMRYLYLGRELGARQTDESCVSNGRVDYGKVASTTAFQEGIERVIQEGSATRISMLCAERDPLQCHRAILVCRELAKKGIPSLHILHDGSVERHEDAEARLVREARMSISDLFLTPREVIDDAYKSRAKRLAYAPLDPEGL